MLELIKYKKGVNPLIATVLLLAFAVSLITIITQLNPFSDECKGIEIHFQDIEGNKRLCYNDNQKTLDVYIKNSEYQIIAFKGIIKGSISDFTIEKMPVNIEINNTKMVSISYDADKYGSIIGLYLKPVVKKGYDAVVCEIKDNISSVRNC